MRNRLAIALVLTLAASLYSGCNKNPEPSPSSDILGDWRVGFYEQELGGECLVEYSFKEDGELTLVMDYGGEKFSIPMLWRTKDGKLYAVQKEEKELYEEEDQEWISVEYKINGNKLEFYEAGKLSVAFTKKN